MSLTIDLSPQEELRLREEAARQGISIEELASQAVKSLLPARNQNAIRALQSLYEIGDEEEQRQTLESLRRAIEEDRLSSRKLFS